jgi:hypothetical protein
MLAQTDFPMIGHALNDERITDGLVMQNVDILAVVYGFFALIFQLHLGSRPAKLLRTPGYQLAAYLLLVLPQLYPKIGQVPKR